MDNEEYITNEKFLEKYEGLVKRVQEAYNALTNSNFAENDTNKRVYQNCLSDLKEKYQEERLYVRDQSEFQEKLQNGELENCSSRQAEEWALNGRFEEILDKILPAKRPPNRNTGRSPVN